MAPPSSDRLARGATELTSGPYSEKDITESSVVLSAFHAQSMDYMETCTRAPKRRLESARRPVTLLLSSAKLPKNRNFPIRAAYGSQIVDERDEELGPPRNLPEEQS